MTVIAYDHVGIRVTNRDRALDFYSQLGFAIDPDFDSGRVAEVVAANGVRINLIFNGVTPPDGKNVLIDGATLWPGVTHAAFVVDRIEAVLEWAARNEVVITEGPVNWGRRLTCFLRDPDGNVLEFNELI